MVEREVAEEERVYVRECRRGENRRRRGRGRGEGVVQGGKVVRIDIFLAVDAGHVKPVTMDSRKAALKSLMKGAVAKREKRIESPFVRYNDLDQAVCKVCDVIIKSEPLWSAHVAGRAHKEAVALLKVRLASGQASGAAGGKSSTSLPPTAPASSTTPTSSKSSGSTRLASELPANFFEEPQKKHHRATADGSTRASAPFQAAKGAAHSQKTAAPSAGTGVEIRTVTAGPATAALGPPTVVVSSSGRGRSSSTSAPARPDSAGATSGGRSTGVTAATSGRERVAKELPAGFFDNEGGRQKPRLPGGGAQQSAPSKAASGRAGETTAAGEDAASSALPEGFFDDVAADHKARGLEMKKVVIQDEVKDFMNMIQRDVQSIELREEEEEFVAAEEREEREEFEHRSFLERMAALKKAKEEKARQHLEKLGGRENGTSGKANTKPGSSSESEDDDDDDDDDLLFDWRAKTL